jgi:hypothetical protein
MGWLFGWNDRRSLIKHLTEPKDNWGKTLVHCLVGNDLWCVHELADGERFIALYMLRGNRFQRDRWGYKDETESMGPIKDSCPLKYLEMVPEPPNEYGRRWREEVRAFHARCRRHVKKGEVWSLVNCNYPWVIIEEARPLRGIHKHAMFRFSRRFLGERIPKHDWWLLATQATQMAKEGGVASDEFRALRDTAVDREQDAGAWQVLSDWLEDHGIFEFRGLLPTLAKKEEAVPV